MLVFTEKFYKDSKRYIELIVYGSNVWTVRMERITKRKFWFNRVERIYQVRYNKSISVSKIVNGERDLVIQKLKEWK